MPDTIRSIIAEADMVSSYNLVFEKQVREVLGMPSTAPLVLDLSKIDYIDSRGLGLCVSILNNAKKRGVSFSIRPSPTVMQLMKMLNLDRVFTFIE